MNVLVTGCSRGVGLEICKQFLEKGHTIYGVSRTYTDEFKLLESKYPEKVFFKSIDLKDVSNIKEIIFKEFIKNISINCFVNNAAIAYDDIITNVNAYNLEETYKVNVFSPILITKYVLRNMILNKVKGNIIHISSVSAHTGYNGLAMYASTKGAIEAFSKNTAREWGRYGIRSNVVVPGFMDTDMSSDLSDEQKERIYKRTSLKKATSIESVAKTVVFIASEAALSITGEKIHVDSGTI
ncbi:MAG: SDR family oxidoreductase [Bacteroidales bacterium]|nr:SDR family oxidoreductase [Bacteroidales bacterium]